MVFILCILLSVLNSINIYSFLITYHDVTSKNSSFVASVAVNNDVNTIWSNPSNIGHIDYIQISFNYGLPLFGLKGSEYISQDDNKNYEPLISENIFSSGFPLKKYGYAGMGVYMLSLGDFFSNSLFFISYGNKINSKLLAGCAIKIFYREYGKDKYTEHYEIFRTKGYSKTAFTVDPALTYKFSENVNFAVALHNLTRPNLSLSNVKEDEYPLTMRTGIAVNMHKYKFGTEILYEIITQTTPNTKFFTSIEYNLLDRIEVNSSVGIGKNNFYSFSFGLRISVIKNLLIGYSLNYPLSGLKNVLNHKAGVDFMFPVYKKKEEIVVPKEQKVEQKIETISSEQQKTKLKIRRSVIEKLRKYFRKE